MLPETQQMLPETRQMLPETRQMLPETQLNTNHSLSRILMKHIRKYN